MKIKTPALISAAFLVYSFAISGWAWSQLPSGASVAVHWNLQGQANGFAGREALFLTPAISVAIAVLLALIPRIEPRRLNLAQSSKAYVAAWIAIMLLLSLVTTVVALNAVGRGALAAPATAIPVGVGLLLIVIGNYLSKVRSNFFFGIRTPWTLSSELAWNKTHRFAARLFVVWGVLVFVSAFVKELAVPVLVGGAVIVLLAPVGYSYMVWRSDPAKLETGRHAV